MNLGEARLSDAQLTMCRNISRVMSAQWANDNGEAAVRTIQDYFPDFRPGHIAARPVGQTPRWLYGTTNRNQMVFISGIESAGQGVELFHWAVNAFPADRPYGVSRAISDFTTPILNQIARLPSSSLPFILSGHSGGGAMCSDIAVSLQAQRGAAAVELLVTFGAPKPGDGRFAALMRTVPHLKICNREDPVPAIPPDRVTSDALITALANSPNPRNRGAPIGRLFALLEASDQLTFNQDLWARFVQTGPSIILTTTGRISDTQTPQIYATDPLAQVVQALRITNGPGTIAHSTEEYTRRLVELVNARRDEQVAQARRQLDQAERDALNRLFPVAGTPWDRVFDQRLWDPATPLQERIDILNGPDPFQQPLRSNEALNELDLRTIGRLQHLEMLDDLLLLAAPRSQPPVRQVVLQSQPPAIVANVPATESVPSSSNVQRSAKVIIPKTLKAAVVRLSTLSYAVVWMELVIANGQSRGQAKTIAKYVNAMLSRLGNAHTVDGGELQSALLQFLTVAPSLTTPPFPVQ